MAYELKQFPHAIGERVQGQDGSGRAFAGTVTSCPGPYSVTLDYHLTVSVTLIKQNGNGQ